MFYNDNLSFVDSGVATDLNGEKGMRHSASLLASLEGMSRSAFRIARELSNNSRSGLTVRFLAKKLEMPEEEIEYLLDINPRLMFLDLTKVKLVTEGNQLIKRISAGLENHGDIPSLFRLIKLLDPHDFRTLEEQIGIEQAATKKMVVEELIERFYKTPDAVVSYVATRGFSEQAKNVFDLLWQSEEGILPASKLRIACDTPEFETEQALWELFRGLACFELFRFDAEDRLVRMVGLLSEIRQFRDQQNQSKRQRVTLKAARGKPESSHQHALHFSDVLCRLVAAIAAKPVRLRGDGELFREDRRRLAEICSEEDEPSLSTCLWVAEGVGWLSRVDNTLRAGMLERLIPLPRVARHRVLYEWFLKQGEDAHARRWLADVLGDLQADTWYPVDNTIQHAIQEGQEKDTPLLKAMESQWQYVSPSASGQTERQLTRALEETFYWLGMVERAQLRNENVFRITPLGNAFINDAYTPDLQALFPSRKGEFIVQPNFDIVVPLQDMDPLLTVPLDQFAVRQSTGQATVYNVSKESFTQAIQDGHDAGAFVAFLLNHNRGGALPTNVTTTLDDWRGGIKRVRLRTIHVLETEDPLVMADLLHRRKFKKYFAEPDPRKTVSYQHISKSELTKALEKDGFIVE